MTHRPVTLAALTRGLFAASSLFALAAFVDVTPAQPEAEVAAQSVAGSLELTAEPFGQAVTGNGVGQEIAFRRGHYREGFAARRGHWKQEIAAQRSHPKYEIAGRRGFARYQPDGRRSHPKYEIAQRRGFGRYQPDGRRGYA